MSRVADALQRSRTAAAAGASAEYSWPPLHGPGPAPTPGSPWSLLGLSPGRPATDLSTDVRLVTCPSCEVAAREQYRRIVAALHQAQIEHDLRTVMVTSALPREGKTLTAVNLALTLSGTYGRRVLLVDADLRRPAVHALLRLENASGLTDMLSNDRPLSLVHLLPGLWVLPAGPSCSDPLGKLMSDATRQVLDEARKLFDWVVVDTPPVGVLPDASVLAAMLEATLLVVAAGRTTYDHVQRASDAIGAGRVFGVVLNRVSEETAEFDYDYYRHYGRERREPRIAASAPSEPAASVSEDSV